MIRLTFDKKNALLDQVEQAGLALGDFMVSSPAIDSVHFEYRHDAFKFFLTKKGADVYGVEFTSIHETGAIQSKYVWENAHLRFVTWLAEIAADRNEMVRFHKRYSSLQIESNEFLSVRFVDILRQAETSENYGLNELCGMAYRKAFEIMIKDYVMIGKDESSRAKIANTQIREVIKTYVNDDDLKLLAHGVLELGNDHAHYILKYTDSNIAELKELIRKSAHWILRHEELKTIEHDRRDEIRQATEKFVRKNLKGELEEPAAS